MAAHTLKFSKEVEEKIKKMEKIGNMNTAALVADALALLDFCTTAAKQGKKVCVITPLEDEGQEIKKIVLPF